LKQSEIMVGKTYFNGEGTERKVNFISRVGILSFQTVKGMKHYQESHLGKNDVSMEIKCFANWAQGVVA